MSNIKDEWITISNYRIEKAEKIIEEAKILLNNNKIEGTINRSYYTIFTIARSLTILFGKDSKKHSGIIWVFDKYVIKTGILDKQFSKIIHSAFDLRSDTDYKDFAVVNLEDAKKQVENAKLFLEEIKKIRDKIIKGDIKIKI